MNKKEQFIYIDEYDTNFHYSDREMRILHREDGPAVEYVDGHKEWWINGKRHREDGPAIEYTNGGKAWFINGEYHREDGPAIDYINGTKVWWLDGKRHREDGPAVESASGSKTWYLNGERLTEEEFNARMNPTTELTLDEIAEKFGIREVKSVTIKFQTSMTF